MKLNRQIRFKVCDVVILNQANFYVWLNYRFHLTYFNRPDKFHECPSLNEYIVQYFPPESQAFSKSMES
jgi:hypothetical protein